MHTNTKSGLGTALTGFLCLLVPAALTLGSVKHPGRLQIDSPDPSPYGYTISLLLFLMPSALLLWWLLRHPQAKIERRAFAATIATVFATGCALDFLLAYSFFYYPNPQATLGLRLPAYSFSQGWIRDVLPIEEFGFYSFGGFFMAALYVWADLAWVPRRHAETPKDFAKAYQQAPLFKFHPWSLLLGLLLIVLALVYRRFVVGGPGFPGYFCFLMLVGFVPTSMLYPVAAPLMNWPAFTLMFVVLQLVSLLWEATVAVPYGWWNYHHEQMLGIFIGPWAFLPIESVLMWIVAGWATVIIYEVFRVWFHTREET